MTNAKPLADRAILITGSGNGIGRAAALLAASRGAIVGVNDLKQEFVDAVVAEIEQAGGRAIGVVQDISTREGVQATIEAFAGQQGRVDGLVNNAAWVRYQSIPDIAPKTMDRMLDIGFKAVVWAIQAAQPHMPKGGSIVNIASAAGFRSAHNSVVYSGIKAGILGITRAAAADLGAQGVRVNAVAPSAIPTEGTVKHRDAAKDTKRISRTPLGRLGTVDEIASVITFLLSDDSAFISGEVISVDGGITNTNI